MHDSLVYIPLVHDSNLRFTWQFDNFARAVRVGICRQVKPGRYRIRWNSWQFFENSAQSHNYVELKSREYGANDQNIRSKFRAGNQRCRDLFLSRHDCPKYDREA